MLATSIPVAKRGSAWRLATRTSTATCRRRQARVRVPTDSANPDSDGDGLGRSGDASSSDEPNDADTDNDCLTDNQEHIGINLVVDEDGQSCGRGGGGCPYLTRYVGHSDPLVNDTDGDELPDHEERQLRTDAELDRHRQRRPDDFIEWNQWYTSPISVDSDQDARGGDGVLPPTESMFDGIELRDVGTSPTLDDTDGDGANDADELDSSVRDPLLAELPQFEMDLAGGTSIRLIKERSDEQGGSISVGLTDSVPRGPPRRRPRRSPRRRRTPCRVELGYEFSAEAGTDTTVTETLSITAGYSHEWSTELNARVLHGGVQGGRPRTSEDRRRVLDLLGDGHPGRDLPGDGVPQHRSVHLRAVEHRLHPVPPGSRTGSYEVVGTMTVPLGGITLAPGARTQPIQVVADDVDVDLIEQFLASPSSTPLRHGQHRVPRQRRPELRVPAGGDLRSDGTGRASTSALEAVGVTGSMSRTRTSRPTSSETSVGGPSNGAPPVPGDPSRLHHRRTCVPAGRHGPDRLPPLLGRRARPGLLHSNRQRSD